MFMYIFGMNVLYENFIRFFSYIINNLKYICVYKVILFCILLLYKLIWGRNRKILSELVDDMFIDRIRRFLVLKKVRLRRERKIKSLRVGRKEWVLCIWFR